LKLGCELNDFSLIKTTNLFNETSVKGVYAAGDITSQYKRSLSQSRREDRAVTNHSLIAEDFV